MQYAGCAEKNRWGIGSRIRSGPDEAGQRRLRRVRSYRDIDDRREDNEPLWWYPRLLNATPKQRVDCRFSPFGIHWEEIDEVLSVEGLLRGAKAPGAKDVKS